MITYVSKAVWLVLSLLILPSCSGQQVLIDSTSPTLQETVKCTKLVKYRNSGGVYVCHPRFEKLTNIGDKSVFGAWYDREHQYMIIQLLQTNYHYCGFGHQDWLALRNASDADEYYPTHIRGRFDCRHGYVPVY